MKYRQKIVLKNGMEALLRNGGAADGSAVYETFNRIHGETDYLLAYPDENSFDPGQEARFPEEKANSPDEAVIIACIDGKAAGTAVVEAVGKKYKVKHRAEFGVSILRE